MEVALGALSRARLRALAEEEDALARDEGSLLHAASAAGAGEVAAAHRPFVRRQARARSRPERLLALLDHSDKLSLTFITLTSLSMWTAASLLTWQALRDGWSLWQLALALGGVLFFAEALPLVIAARSPEPIALRGVRLVEKSVQVLAPLTWLLGGVGAGVARLFGARPHAKPQVTEGELRQALDQAEHEGVIEPEERAMLESAIDFRAKSVSDVMTARIDIVGVPAMMPLRAVLDVAMKQGHSRLPVYEGSTDHIVGIIATKDLLPHLRPSAPTSTQETLSARDVARPPFFLPASKRVDAAIDDLRRQRTLMAIVVEPDGGTAGLVTLEDLLEEIVGEIEDEYDEDEAPLRLLEEAFGDELPQDTENAARGIVADASCTVRQAEAFWKRHFRECLVLFERAPGGGAAAPDSRLPLGAAASESLTLAALAQQLFDGVPEQGQRVAAGAICEGARVRAAAPAAGWAAAIDMEISKAVGPRLAEVRLVRAAQVLEK
jgi:CBS domain containing-hemolysin-like protein